MANGDDDDDGDERDSEGRAPYESYGESITLRFGDVVIPHIPRVCDVMGTTRAVLKRLRLMASLHDQDRAPVAGLGSGGRRQVGPVELALEPSGLGGGVKGAQAKVQA